MNCLICNRETSNFKDSHLKCNNCGVIFQKDRKPLVSYDEKYIDQYNLYHTTRMMSLLRAGIVSSFCKDNSTILDIGCGNGDFLKVMNINGHHCYGFDVNDKKLTCIDMISYDEIFNKSWDVVTFFDSLEHIDDVTIVRNINSNVFVLSVPSVPEDLRDIENWKHWKPGEHFWHFSKKSLELLFYNFNLVSESHAEDLIRGKLSNKKNNISTYVFRKK